MVFVFRGFRSFRSFRFLTPVLAVFAIFAVLAVFVVFVFFAVFAIFVFRGFRGFGFLTACAVLVPHNPFARNEVRSPKTEVKLRFPSCPGICV